MADLFQRIEDRRDDWDVEVTVTFLEIYNEEIRDLLVEPGSHVPRGGLSIREDKTVKVVGLTELKPRTAEEVKEIVLLGNSRRTQSPTHANETSSRSHAVLQVHVSQTPRTPGLTEQRTMGTLSIIDLAGSERAAATTNMGQRMVEGANINKSLLALGNCINALCESGGAVRHVPYRNSKLTRLLKFSLGGNCKTVMVVCISPTSNHFDDTHNTLIYAERATKIKTKVVTRNVVNVDRHVGRYVEAINRLNMEIVELKEKLTGKRKGEQEIQVRKQAEARAEVERARSDIRQKMAQTEPSIVDGATCSGKLNVANIKLEAIRGRLAQLHAETPTSASQAEIALLQALAGPEEDAVKPGSMLNVRLQRSSNSNAMFDATMRAVAERKSEKLDEISAENVKLEASYTRAAIDKLRAKSEREAMKGAVVDMADLVVKLVGMLGRCTVSAGEAANVLKASVNPDEDTAKNVRRIAACLETMKETNDATFKTLLGRSVESYIVHDTKESSIFDSFQSYGVGYGLRVTSGPAILQHGTKSSTSRRSSYNNLSVSASPSRRTHRTPRKSLRPSLAPYRRAPEEKKTVKAVKNVQWRDEAGQGNLDDAGDKTLPLPTVSLQITPASPAMDSAPSQQSSSPAQRCPSALGSESEWEDEDKTDDSLSMSFLSASQSSVPLASTSSRNSRRPRPSRLDPTFLRSNSRTSTLTSLKEDDETTESRMYPLSDRNMNRSSLDDSASGSSDGNLHVPKNQDRLPGSPRRAPSTGKASLHSSTGKASSRRRSNVGLMRIEKGRRRSSLIPQISPQVIENAKGTARRVLISATLSPAKRTKRPSLTKSLTIGSSKARSSSSLGAANLSAIFDPNASLDSNAKFGKPSWR